jgi:DNA repair protein RadC
MCEAGQLLGIHLLDFVIVGGTTSVSFADRGWMRRAA